MSRYSHSGQSHYQDRSYYNWDQEGYYNSGREALYHGFSQESDQSEYHYGPSSSYPQSEYQQGWVDYPTPGPWVSGYVQWNQHDYYHTAEYRNNQPSADSYHSNSHYHTADRTHRGYSREAERRTYHSSSQTASSSRAALNRSPTPPPPPQRSPSPGYVAISRTPSTPIPPTASARKLLILDLNGTLLIRAAYVRHHQPSGLRLRPVHPRPYMPAFRAYLFAQKTQAWLDVMVWSSAQPHSVADMVDRCFGKEKEKLAAVWARDTLGLSEGDYNRKAQTTKDLTKPWMLFPSSSSSPTPLRRSSRFSTDGRKSTNKDPDLVHSARTTLLLDDSPLKAHLQPYNHVCIKEYVAELRARDLELAKSEEREKELVQTKDREESNDQPLEEGGDTDVEGQKKKRKRKRKKKSPENASSEGSASSEGGQYDETLLAIIGVLDTIKGESNVAGWIRNGGLWGPMARPSVVEGGQAGGLLTTEESSVPRKERKRQRRQVQDLGEANAGKTGNDAETISPLDGVNKDEADLPIGKESVHNTATTTAKGLLRTEDVGPQPLRVASSETTPPALKMWFDNPETVEYWVVRGRRALEALGIGLTHGIDR